MPDILHISDLHFGPPFLRDRAEGVLELARRSRPDLVVVSGDLTQRAKKRQFAAAREYLDRFEPPVVTTPGNHDVPLYRVFERIFRPWENYRAYISPRLDEVTRLEDATIVSLNSSRRLTVTDGKLSDHQLEFAVRTFREAPAQHLRIVVTHHHLAPPPDFARDGVMPGALSALELFQDLEVDLIMAGHMHRSYIGDTLDFFPGEDRERGIVVVQCGTTTSARGRGRERFKNSLNMIRARAGHIDVTHYLWRDAEHGFWPHSRHRFGTRPEIWLDASTERRELKRRGA